LQAGEKHEPLIQNALLSDD